MSIYIGSLYAVLCGIRGLFSPKETLNKLGREAIFGQERTPSSFVIICSQVRNLLTRLLDDLLSEMFDKTKLNPLARAVAQELFAEFPEWKCFVCLDSAAEVEPGALVVKIPNDYGDFLVIDTYDGEITVCFDLWHAHFSETESFREVIDSVREVIEDKFVLHVEMNGKQWCGTYCKEPGTRPDLTGFDPDSTVYVRSWSRPPRVYSVSEILMSGLSPNANKVVIAKLLSDRMHWSLTEARQALQELIRGNPVSITVSDYDAAEVSRKLSQSGVRLK